MSKYRHESTAKVASTHRDNLQKNLQRRLEAARTAGNEALVRQLEAEASYLR
jgi:hypothetical protein